MAGTIYIVDHNHVSVLIIGNESIESNDFREILTLSGLKYLYIIDSQVEEIPPQIGQLKELIGLDLSNNPIETLPDSFAQLTSLKFLALKNTNFKQIPKVLDSMPNLVEINFEEVEFENTNENTIVKQGTEMIKAYCRKKPDWHSDQFTPEDIEE